MFLKCFIEIPDAGQSPTLARPAAPLAACVRRHPCTKPTKFGCYGNAPWGSLSDRKTNFRLVIYSCSSTNPANLAKIGPVGAEIIGLTRIHKK